MKIKVEWKRETEGVSEIEVDEAAVIAWLNEWSQEPVTTATPQDCFDFLQSGADDKCANCGTRNPRD
jgi:hypothetical protein